MSEEVDYINKDGGSKKVVWILKMSIYKKVIEFSIHSSILKDNQRKEVVVEEEFNKENPILFDFSDRLMKLSLIIYDMIMLVVINLVLLYFKLSMYIPLSSIILK